MGQTTAFGELASLDTVCRDVHFADLGMAEKPSSPVSVQKVLCRAMFIVFLANLSFSLHASGWVAD